LVDNDFLFHSSYSLFSGNTKQYNLYIFRMFRFYINIYMFVIGKHIKKMFHHITGTIFKLTNIVYIVNI